MASEKPETDGFLALLEAKIAALLALKETYLRTVSLGSNDCWHRTDGKGTH